MPAIPPPIEITLPKDVDIDGSTDRNLHSSIKDWDGYESLKLPKSVFFKASKITSPDFLEANPLVVKVRQNRRIIAYGYQRANRAKDHGEPLVQKRFGIRQSLADALESRAESEKVPQVELVERALAAFLTAAHGPE